MIVKSLVDEDFVNYKKPAMFIAFPKCNWKCEKECGLQVCQNSTLAKSSDIEIEPETIVNRYLKNSITKALVCGGLEPLDTWYELLDLVFEFRQKTDDDIVIQTGYTETEVSKMPVILEKLSSYKNIIIKFGRFVPNQEPHYDEVLGVKLASNNQYGKIISKEHYKNEN